IMHFRKKSTASTVSSKNIKLTKKDAENFKMRTGNVHDPILSAVNEAQPFEQANDGFNQTNQQLGLAYMAKTGNLKDSFGNLITTPDISNPTRSRDERPLDTIKSFEYAITGDTYFKSNLETPIYGWTVRPNFPLFTNGNPYANNNNKEPQVVYKPKLDSNTNQPKKKKRGFFRRRK
ncbi:DUF2406 domain-containing protein ASCRUDRAFT_16822, partial [Ascoidea rubescens DSM 1968]